MQRFTGREYQIAFNQFDARSLQELLRFLIDAEYEHRGFVTQDLEQALPASLHETIEQPEPKRALVLIERQNDEDRTYRVAYGELLAPIVKSIQEQQQEIVAERQQNADLRHALKTLQGEVAAFKAVNDALRHSIEALRGQVSAARQWRQAAILANPGSTRTQLARRSDSASLDGRP